MNAKNKQTHDKRRIFAFSLQSSCDVSHFMSRADEEQYKGTLDTKDCQVIAERFGFLDIHSVSVALSVKMVAKNSFVVKGSVGAHVTQACVMTAEPVSETISLQIEDRYVPEIDDVVDQEIEIDVTAVDVELLEDGLIPLGELVQQTIALGVDNHPRLENAPEQYLSGPEITPENPFQKLSELKK